MRIRETKPTNQKPIEIDPKKLTLANLNKVPSLIVQACWLKTFLRYDEKEYSQDIGNSRKVFESQRIYEFQGIHITFKENLVRETHANSTKNSKIYFYNVFSETNKLGKGAFGSVYKISGILIHLHQCMIFNSDQVRVIKQIRIKNFECVSTNCHNKTSSTV